MIMTNSTNSTPPPSHDTLPSDLTSSPFLRTSATLSPNPPLSFSTVIEDDHSRINAAIIKLGRHLHRSLKPPVTGSSPPSIETLKGLRKERLELLQEMTWRLVRHDVSEDLIMRPAFARWLGREGEEMGEHDRRDHDHARDELVRLYDAFEALPLDVSSISSSEAVGKGNPREEFAALAKWFRDLMAELTEHMKVESGMQIPRLEGVLSREVSEGLSRRYIATYVLEPGMVVRGKRVWSEVGEYVKETREGFHRLWREVEDGEQRPATGKL